MMEKLTYTNVVEEIGIFHSSEGWEYIFDDYNFDFVPKSMMDRTKEEKPYIKEANKELVIWKRGLKRVIKMAKQGPSTIDKMASAYTGNGPKNNIEYFWSLYKTLGYDTILKMGEDKSLFPTITSYVDGTYDYSI